MRQATKKRAAIDRAARAPRSALREECGRCEACGHGPEKPHKQLPLDMSKLHIHELDNGGGRKACQDKRYGTLCLCAWCNLHVFTNKTRWPVAKQLCLLRHCRPLDYCLKSFVKLVKDGRAPNWITSSEVDAYEAEIAELVALRDDTALDFDLWA